MGLALEKLPDWPVALTREEALAYTRVAEKQMREWERRGIVRFVTRGPNSQAIALRADLDAAVKRLFVSNDTAAPIEFDDD